MARTFTRMALFSAAAATLLLTACVPQRPVAQAYWQRVEDRSALWMTGPKAQQELDQNIATCVREIDELVRLDALRETTPPDTHSEYHRALDSSGDLDYYDTPTRMGEHMVSHSDFHDFESCMRSKGWERVRYVRYQTDLKAQETYKATQEIRKYGVSGDQVKVMQQKQAADMQQNNQFNN